MSIDPFDPVLDRPRSIDYDELDPAARDWLANGDLVFAVDGATDLHDLYWPWADAVYARHIRIRVTDLHDDEFTPLVTQYLPGFQETIIGTEGMIVSKRLAAPLHAAYERAVIWLLECQAEGDRLLRIDVQIDWGEPLTQRMVDGLLVAQANPQSAQGVYQQQNADSTRVFGSPESRPVAVDLDMPGQAHLSYLVLVNGQVEVPLLLTVSDVGEQVAWNGFLALRDAGRAFELSVGAWDRLLQTGRLWGRDPRIGHAVQQGRVAALRHTQRLRTGQAATDRALAHIPALVAALDTLDPVQSRNLLANLRRLAERTGGRLPVRSPLHHRSPVDDPGPALVETTAAYVTALARHLHHHFDAATLAAHRDGLSVCCEALIAARVAGELDTAGTLATGGRLLDAASQLARAASWDADAVRWQSEAALLHAGQDGATATADIAGQGAVVNIASAPDAGPTTVAAIAKAAQVETLLWQRYGISRQPDGRFAVMPPEDATADWWALVDLPVDADERLTLVWDGHTLHTTRPVATVLPLQQHDAIRTRHSDELNFDLQFDFLDNGDSGPVSHRFHPTFLTADSAPNSTAFHDQ